MPNGDILKELDKETIIPKLFYKPLNNDFEYSCRKEYGAYRISSDIKPDSFNIPKIALYVPYGVTVFLSRKQDNTVYCLENRNICDDNIYIDGVEYVAYVVDLSPGGVLFYVFNPTDISISLKS